MNTPIKPAIAGLAMAAAIAACAPNTGTSPVVGGSAMPTMAPSTGATMTPSAMPSTGATATPSTTPSTQAMTQYFVADMTGAAQKPTAVTTAPGAGGFTVATLSPDDTTLKFWTWSAGLSGDITAAHIHRGGVNDAGAVLKEFAVGTDKTMAMATWMAGEGTGMFTGANLADLEASNTYANAHTARYPDGEIRGQFTKTGWVFATVLTGGEETPAVTTTARGVSWATLGENRQRVNVKIYTSGLSGDIMGAHIHKGAKGAAGDVVKALDVTADKRGVTGEWVVGDGAGGLTQALLADMEAGNLYVNVHTAAHPDGEIRGQLMLVK